MAEGKTEQQVKDVKYNIYTTLKSAGFKDAATEMEKVYKEATKMEKQYGDIRIAVDEVMKSYKKMSKSQDALGQSMQRLSSGFSSFAKNLLLGNVFGSKFTNVLENLDKSYIKVSATALQFGIGFK